MFLLWPTISICQSLESQTQDKLIGINQIHQNHIGLLIYDLTSRKELFQFQKNQHFIPASNAKILTLYSCLKALKDSLPVFDYQKNGDTICFRGKANPSLLHHEFNPMGAVQMLATATNLRFDSSNYFGQKYGPGWAWDDYEGAFQAEISPLPIYSQVLRLIKSPSGELKANIPYFLPYVDHVENTFPYSRSINQNRFFIRDSESTSNIAFLSSPDLNTYLLGEYMGKRIRLGSCKANKRYTTFYQTGADTLYKKMMYESDNFLAEHLLLMAGQKFTDSIGTHIALQNLKTAYFPNFTGKWVDGSGNSRYNLLSPSFIIDLLKTMNDEFGFQEISTYFPQAGISGTIRSSFAKPYPIYMKSGSMGGIYNLSGYVITKSGKKLAVSCMTNNSLYPYARIRKEVSDLIVWIWENY
ncbi:MAG: D-alanyl-D-alanine carboxypeptidase [Leadbetterella sp.]